MYRGKARLGSMPAAKPAKNKIAGTTRSQRPMTALDPSRKVFEFLNHHLGPITERNPGFPIDVEVHTDRFNGGGWYAGRENMLGNRALRSTVRGAARGLERDAPTLPMERVGQDTRGRAKTGDVGWNIVRLDGKLSISVVRVAPAADLDVDFAEVLVGLRVIPSEHAEDRRRVQIGCIAHCEGICSISQTARKADLGARPAIRSLRNPEMQSSIRIGPGVVGTVLIVSAAAAAGTIAYPPLISAETDHRRGRRIQSFDACHGDHQTARSWQRLDCGGRCVSRFHEQGGVLGAEMRRACPDPISTGVSLNLRERPGDKRLNPPLPALGV